MRRNVAILGAGIGAEHLTAYLSLPARFQVTHICDVNEARAQNLAVRAGARTTDDIGQILTNPDIDIVDICLPPALHMPVACDVLSAGKHVILEKPIAGSLREAEQLAVAQSQTIGRVFPVFQYRFARAFRILSRLDAMGFLGQPRVAALELHWNRGADYYAVPWRGKWQGEGGGVILNHAIHLHDLLTYLFGPVVQVSAMLATKINPIETEDCAAVCMRMKNGALASSSLTLGAAANSCRLRLVFEKMTAESQDLPYAPGEAEWVFHARAPQYQEKIDQIAAETPAALEGFRGCFTAIADALDGQEKNMVTLDDAIASIELATAIYQAARTGEHVSLPLSRDLPILQRLQP